MAEKFTARTRVRGTVGYYKAEWRLVHPEDFDIEFLEGPYKGRILQSQHCAIAQDEAWKIKKFSEKEKEENEEI